MHYPILILNKKKEEKPTRKTRLAQCSFFKLAWRRAGQLKVPSRIHPSGPQKMAGSTRFATPTKIVDWTEELFVVPSLI
jgi:hypothetical protein